MVLLCAWYVLCSSGLWTHVHQPYPTVYSGTEFLSLTASVYWPTYYVMWIIAWLCKRWRLSLHLKGRCGGMGREILSSALHRLQRKPTKKGGEKVTDCLPPFSDSICSERIEWQQCLGMQVYLHGFAHSTVFSIGKYSRELHPLQCNLYLVLETRTCLTKTKIKGEVRPTGGVWPGRKELKSPGHEGTAE